LDLSNYGVGTNEEWIKGVKSLQT